MTHPLTPCASSTTETKNVLGDVAPESALSEDGPASSVHANCTTWMTDPFLASAPEELAVDGLEWMLEAENTVNTEAAAIGQCSTPGKRLSPREALVILLNAPPYVQDICALARSYAAFTERSGCLCYAPMRALWQSSNAVALHSANPRWQRPEEFLQYVLQTCVMLLSRPDLSGTAHDDGARAGALFITALLLATQPVRYKEDATRIRLTPAGAAAVRAASTLSTDAAAAAAAVFAVMDPVAMLAHGSAHVPESLVGSHPHPALRCWPRLYDVDPVVVLRATAERADASVRPPVDERKMEIEKIEDEVQAHRAETMRLEQALVSAIENLNAGRTHTLKRRVAEKAENSAALQGEVKRLRRLLERAEQARN